jgi:uncharacterized membrane protein
MKHEKRAGKGKGDPWAPALKPSRIEALTDGVFAIAMTILVLELSIPNFIGTHTGGEEAPRSFFEMIPEFYVYALGFVVLGIYWILHRYMFHFIKRSDGVLVWLNILFLMFAAAVPFTTAVLRVNESLTPGVQAASQMPWVFNAASEIITILILLGIWQYATGKRRLVDQDIDERVVRVFKKIILIGMSIMLVGFALSFFLPPASILSGISAVYMIVVTARARHGTLS